MTNSSPLTLTCALRELDARTIEDVARGFRVAVATQLKSGRSGLALRDNVLGLTIVASVESMGSRARSWREPNVPPTVVVDVWRGFDHVSEIRVSSLRGVFGVVRSALTEAV